MLVMFVIGGYLLVSKEDLVVPNYILMPMTFDLIGMGMCIMLYLALYSDRYTDLGSHYFILLIIEMFMIFFGSIISWSCELDPSKNLFNELGLLVSYEVMILATLTFWLYLTYVIGVRNRRVKVLNVLNMLLFLIGSFLIISNFFNHQLFYVNGAGEYVRTSFSDLALVAPLSILLMSNVAIFFYIRGLRRKVSLFCIVLLPIIATVMEAYFGSVELMYIITFFSLLIIYGNFYVGRSEELLKKESELVKQRADILVSQIQPHFLYNALTSIMNIKGNPPDTMFAIADFGKYLRGNLDSLKQRAPIPVAKELDHVETFMILEQLSLGTGLELEMNIHDRNFLVPALSLQKLVEKCIENGYPPNNPKGKIILTTDETDNSHIVTVEDDGTGFDASAVLDKERAEVFGLYTIQHRIEEQVDGTLDIESQIGKGTLITIVIPKVESRGSGFRFF